LEKSEVQKRIQRLKYGFVRAYYDRKCWHYLLIPFGMVTTFLMATLTSGYVWANDENQDGGAGTGPNGGDDDPSFVPNPVPVYLAIYPDASSWKGPLILAYVGSFLSLPVKVMHKRVTAHWKRLKKAKKDAVEMQGMDRA
jgi:hypothetical protein